MGSGIYSSATYSSLCEDREYSTRSADAVFRNKSLSAKSDIKLSNVNARTYNTQVKKEMINVGVRESRDSQEHPNTTPIIVALDVTGSMRTTPHEMIKDCFPKLMDAIIQIGVKDPQLLFMAVGDHEYDRYPIQVGQFESDTEKIVNSLEELVLEGGGGGNSGESYLLAHIIGGYHTEIDSWYKRGKKGYLFTIGDEPPLLEVDGNSLVDFLGYQKPANTITAEEAVTKAQEQYHVFHIHITNGSRGSKVHPRWTSLLGQNILTTHSNDIHNVIAEAIRNGEESYQPCIAQYTPEYPSANSEDMVGTYTY